MKSPLASRLLIAVCTAAIALAARGDDVAPHAYWPKNEFEFVRMIYFGNWRGGSSWTVDYPEAEDFFHRGVSRLTRIDMAGGGRYDLGQQFELTDDAIFDYPWMYAVEVGHWQLSDVEAERLREYLLRGGFLMVDDFHGTNEWLYFTESMNRVFPDRPIVDIADASEILHVVYDVDERVQIPGIVSIMNGTTFEQDGVLPEWKGIYDDRGRLMVIINHNMDLGDAWEHADYPYYPEQFTSLAYRFGVNYVVYAMTH